eukprot:7075265-Alexandrium_andersonii.AAC.1
MCIRDSSPAQRGPPPDPSPVPISVSSGGVQSSASSASPATRFDRLQKMLDKQLHAIRTQSASHDVNPP